MSRRSSLPFIWRRAIRESDLPSTTRLVAFVQETFMDADGLSWPSTATVATGAGLSERAVEQHRARLEAEGWLVAEDDGRGGKARTRRYVAALPATANDVRRSEWQRAKRTQADGEPRVVDGERRSPEAVKDEEAAAALNGRPPLPEGECARCGDVRPLVDRRALYCEGCVG